MKSKRNPVAKNVNVVRCATHKDRKKESKKYPKDLEQLDLFRGGNV